MKFVCKHFNELTLDELYEALQLRQMVFILEQNCPYDDLDFKDQNAYHITGIQNNKIVAYARLFGPNDYFQGACSFGRVVNHPKLRGQGVGKQLVAKCIEECQHRWPNSKIEISGQLYLEKFYKDFGMTPQGDVYLEDGIEHKRFILD